MLTSPQIEYTFKQVYPVLAIIEDENPPAYEPVSLNDDDARSLPDQELGGAPSKPTDGRAQTVTSSFRAIHRLLRAHGGFRANFRGLACFLAQGLFASFLIGIFTGVLGVAASPVATLLASLTLVQFSTAWVHIVVSPRSPLHFWRRLPPFKRTFEATWKPVTIFWLATEVHRWVPELLGPLIGLNLPKVNWQDPFAVDEPTNDDLNILWQALVILIVSVAVAVLVVLPAHVVLVRVQASLLEPDQETIIPFDRSFEGRVEPAVVTGRGHATMKDAWVTFSRSAWRRLVILQIKIFAVALVGMFVIVGFLVPQVVLIMNSAKKVEQGGDL